MSVFLKPGLASAFLLSASIQASAFLFSTVGRQVPTEKYYDLSGSFTHLALAAQALYVASTSHSSSSPTFNPRVTLLASLSALWALRLGSYLYLRIHRLGKDERFDQLKNSKGQWPIPWAFQVIWCTALQAPLTMIAANPIVTKSLNFKDLLSALVFIGGLTWESVADKQKSNWKASHPNDPITSGLYRYSVYANYWGEFTLWWGAYFLASPALISPVQHLLGMSSPLFTTFLLHFVSGIPLLEKSAWKKYGHLPGYLDYRAKTSKFVPLPPKKQITNQDLDFASQQANRCQEGSKAKTK